MKPHVGWASGPASSLPLSLGGDSPIGILSFNTTREERSWPPDLIERLKLVAEIVANALARKKADHDLRESVEAQHIAMQQTIELRDTLAHTGRVSLIGQLASALAHELSQPLGAILRNAEAAEIMLKQAAPDTEELRAIVDDILRDDHRAGEVINKLRSLLRKGELEARSRSTCRSDRGRARLGAIRRLEPAMSGSMWTSTPGFPMFAATASTSNRYCST